MKKIYLLLEFFLVLTFVACSPLDKNDNTLNTFNNEVTLYSKAVQDSFVISVQLPEDYYTHSKIKFPTVYMLDANFHFPILASTVRQYEKGGLLPQVILIGIGYKSFKLMDSLRVRDYMYPAALSSDEMNAVGGGKKFDDLSQSNWFLILTQTTRLIKPIVLY